MNSPLLDYTLLDSGDGRKLERYGDKIIDRPSSLSTWRKRLPSSEWEKADAVYELTDRWSVQTAPFTTWEMKVGAVTLVLELMTNGQVGVFPEHALYLPDLSAELDVLAAIQKRPLKVLNLFAYTGLASMLCALRGDSQITHVDLSKRTIEWAKRNLAINSLPNDKIRWIEDDALAFMAREGRKDSRYDVIIIDPPSFSRVSKNNSWTLDEKVDEIVHLFLAVLEPSASAVFFTNHSSASTVDIARNIALDHFSDRGLSVEIRSLAIGEQQTERRLPAGSLIKLSHRS
jgi:23S rRNA (cytosine1962-C5)-methyltransferase